MAVLISGASTGIGRACALHMDKLGWRVFAGVRRQEDEQSLREAASPRLTPVFLDVTDVSSISTAVAVVREAAGGAGLSGLVNNAGVPMGGPVEFLDLDKVRAGFDVNVFGALALIQACLPMLRAAEGRIVNMSSVSGLFASPFLGPYSGSKFALEAFSDSLRVELKPWHISVSVVQPGPIDTPIWSKGGALLQDIMGRAPDAARAMYGPVADVVLEGLAPHGEPPEKIAEVVAHALTARHPKTRYRPGPGPKLVAALRLLPDRWRDWIIATRLPEWG